MALFAQLAISNFNSYTAPDTTPNSVVFTSQVNAVRSALTNSNTVIVTGFNVAVPISSTGGAFRINGGSSMTSGFISPGDSLQAIVTASANYSTAATVSINLSGAVYTFTVTTGNSPSLIDTIFAAGTGAPPTISADSMTTGATGTGVKSAYASGLAIPRDNNTYYWEATGGASYVRFTSAGVGSTTPDYGTILRFTARGPTGSSDWQTRISSTTGGTFTNGNFSISVWPTLYPALTFSTLNRTHTMRFRASQWQYTVPAGCIALVPG